ncbi:MAG: hypothetical protein BGO68_00345 [Candidatus Amoebophilus sp. 36-38]|nr:MAG: hypothetical protein BGO68_00345 [Candidatus Amoebophilus sp. 36-38]
MTLATEQTAFLYILFSVVGVVVLTTVAAWVSAWLRPHRPNLEKLATYESGMEPVGNAWGPVNSRLYVIGLIFILFELETILLFPWATVWIEERTQQISNGIWNVYMAISGTFFIVMLGIGLAYAMIKGSNMLSSPIVTPQQTLPTGRVPLSYYEKINAKYANLDETT